MSSTPHDGQPLHGGNVYFPVKADEYEYGLSATQELLAVGGMFSITLVAGLVGVCIILGYGWAHLVALLTP